MSGDVVVSVLDWDPDEQEVRSVTQSSIRDSCAQASEFGAAVFRFSVRRRQRQRNDVIKYGCYVNW